MALLPILEAPHPILSQKARPVSPEEFGPELVQLLKDMTETMYDAPGVGLAAPQIGDSRRILVADPNNNEEGDPTLYTMVNPKILSKKPEIITYEESCLSVPEFHQNVKRFEEIMVEWQDGNGIVHREVFKGFPAIVLQHEMDHLEGITLLDKTSAFKRSRYMSKQKKQRKKNR